MHQHIGAGKGYIFFSQNASAFVLVCDDYLNFFRCFLVAVGGFAAAVAEDRAAAFVSHANGHKEGVGIGAAFLWSEGQTGFFIHLPDTGSQQIFAFFHKTSGEFIYISADGIAVLTDQNNLVFVLSVNSVQDHTVGFVAVCNRLQCVGVGISGCHIIRSHFAVPVNGFHFVKV